MANGGEFCRRTMKKPQAQSIGGRHGGVVSKDANRSILLVEHGSFLRDRNTEISVPRQSLSNSFGAAFHELRGAVPANACRVSRVV